jgi:hypothetical protein
MNPGLPLNHFFSLIESPCFDAKDCLPAILYPYAARIKKPPRKTTPKARRTYTIPLIISYTARYNMGGRIKRLKRS